jgi:HlyD family secretion protein
VQTGNSAETKAAEKRSATDPRPPTAAQPARPSGSNNRDEPAVLPKRRSRLPLLILLIVVIAGAAAFYFWQRDERHAQAASQLVLQGNIDVRQVNLAFKVDGRIVDLTVDEGDAVTAGQVVAALDKRYFDDDLLLVRARRDNAAAVLARLENGSRPEEIAEAQAQETEQRATLARARQDYDRAEGLVGQGAISREDFDRASSTLKESEARLTYAQQALQLAKIGPRQEDIDAARAQLAAQDAELLQSERRAADSELTAPSAGIILTRAREKGAIVAAGETVFALTLASPVWVRTYVNERDLGRIRPDMPAAVRTDSAPGKVYHGKIGFISPTAEFTPKTVETRELRTDLVYRLRVVVDNPDGGLRQGMPVTVTLELDKDD